MNEHIYNLLIWMHAQNDRQVNMTDIKEDEAVGNLVPKLGKPCLMAWPTQLEIAKSSHIITTTVEENVDMKLE